MRFLSDKPIEKITQDKLNRLKFTHQLVSAIVSLEHEDCVVIGLYGQWGSGKTSLINLFTEQFKEKIKEISENDKYLVVNFNPWYFSYQDKLYQSFFSNLLAEISLVSLSSSLGNLLSSYSKYFFPLSSNCDSPEVLTPELTFSQTVVKAKQELSEVLSAEFKAVIIIIDDIDRLNKKEIYQIFQLVKLISNFPNFVYILSFDVSVVKKALEEIQDGFGKEYLEKIVQIEVQVPPVNPTDVGLLLIDMLKEIIQLVPKEKWDMERWGNMYYLGFKKFFNTLRDVKRYINAVKFTYPPVRDRVNPMDFFVIEAIRLFAREIFMLYFHKKELFIGYEDPRLASIVKSKIETMSYQEPDNLLEPLFAFIKDDEQKKSVTELTKLLFPLTDPDQTTLRDTFSARQLEAMWQREGRICCYRYFDYYFSFI